MSEINRETKETKISIKLSVYGSGKSSISSGVGFLDHMLESLAKHALWDLEVKCVGDTHIDDHHSVEDIGIVLGEAFKKEVYPISKIERFSDSIVVMDEAAVRSALDICNRAYLYFDLPIDGKVGQFDVELVEEFFRAFVNSASITLHTEMIRGKNKHHIIEAAFKSLAVALRRALSKNERAQIPSTKGVL